MDDHPHMTEDIGGMFMTSTRSSCKDLAENSAAEVNGDRCMRLH